MVVYSDKGAKANHVVLLSVNWSLLGVAILFFLARLVVRFKFSKRLFVDDWLAGFATLTLLAHALLTHFMLPSMYVTLQMQQFSGSIKRAAQVDIFANIILFLKLQFSETLIYWTCLWTVKASFLAFFKRLTTNVKGHLIAWWIIVIITALAYVGSVISYPISCSDFSPIGCTKPKNVRLALVSLRFSTAIDVITDILIMALPMSLAWRVKLPLKARLALVGVFSLGGVIVIFAIMRVVFTNKQHRQPEVSWLNLWSGIEAAVACIVCNLAPFKILFKGRVHNYSSDPYYYGRRYAKKEKSDLESHELSNPDSYRKPEYPYGLDIKGPVEEVFEQHPAVRPMRTAGDASFPIAHPQRAKQTNLRTRITGDADKAGRRSFSKDGIVVTKELDRRVMSADQATMDSVATEHERVHSMRTTWIERGSDDSLEQMLPNKASPDESKQLRVRNDTLGLAV